MENLEFWFVAHLKDLNKVKKLLLHRLEAKLEKIAANTIYEALCKMSEDERKHFTLKNKAYIDAVKVDSGVSERQREHDCAFEMDLRKLTLTNRLKLADDLAKYIDQFHPTR